MSVHETNKLARSTPDHAVTDVESIATTLVDSASSSAIHSLDETWELEGRRSDKLHHQQRQDDDGEDADSQHGDGEDAQLLAHEDPVLNHANPGPTHKEKPKQVSWASLPKKSQLAIMTIARLSEPLTQTSLQSYMFYQLKSFKLPDGSIPSDSTVASQAGALAAAFTGAQFLTAMMWGRLADSDRMGRKRVILIGLLGTAIGSLGFGFSDNFAVAVMWRIVGGMLNGNIGVMRTMISEIVKEKKFQSRAFLLLPMTFNIGVIIGPMLGGFLADPVGSYPHIFGPGGSLGGKDGVWLFTRWPYVLPNLISAGFLFLGAMAVLFGLEETLEARRDKADYGLQISRWIGRRMFRKRNQHHYSTVSDGSIDCDIELRAEAIPKPKSKTRNKLPFSRIWTPNVLFTLLAHGLLAMHVGTFNSLWFVFLSTPRYDPVSPRDAAVEGTPLQLPPGYKQHLPFTFTGGLALPPPSIGTALSILGVIGITLQLALYPPLSFRLGTIKSYRASLLLFPIAYLLTPFLAVIPSSLAPPGQASGVLVWASITVVLAIQVLARTFALPATAILINNCSPHPSVLGTIHGIGQSVSSGTRTIGPILAGWVYGLGLNNGVVGTAWWGMMGVAVVGAIAGQWVKDGDGHEIWLPGEKEEISEDR